MFVNTKDRELEQPKVKLKPKLVVPRTESFVNDLSAKLKAIQEGKNLSFSTSALLQANHDQNDKTDKQQSPAISLRVCTHTTRTSMSKIRPRKTNPVPIIASMLICGRQAIST